MINTKVRLIIFFAAENRKALYSQQKQDLEPDCGSHHQFLIAKFKLKWKKVGKTTRPFRYDLNQSLTVEVTKRLKELDLIDRVPEELRTEVCDIAQDIAM